MLVKNILEFLKIDSYFISQLVSWICIKYTKTSMHNLYELLVWYYSLNILLWYRRTKL